MRRGKRVRIIELPKEDPVRKVYTVPKGIPVELPATPELVPVEIPTRKKEEHAQPSHSEGSAMVR